MQKRNTAQKKAIFEELRARRDHPSATRLYEDLKERYPNLSKATVYRVLKNAADEGEILRLHVGPEDRFDGDAKDHLHVICTRCGDVHDEALPPMGLEKLEKNYGYAISSRHVELYGVCPACQKAAE
ncbi:MAG: transcriptional repressor [Clostridia bacterium]|nr:transcriptional repressor [Clostridia bacterium]